MQTSIANEVVSRRRSASAGGQVSLRLLRNERETA
jgi:hypothetical protein